MTTLHQVFFFVAYVAQRRNIPESVVQTPLDRPTWTPGHQKCSDRLSSLGCSGAPNADIVHLMSA